MQNVELVYLFVAYAMAGIMFCATKHKQFPTFSHVALGHKVARHTFFWGLLSAGLLFALLMYGWFIPNFGLHNAFGVLVMVLVASQILTGFFPVQNNRLGRLHAVFGSIMAVSMVTLLAVLAFTATIHPIIRILNGAIVISMLSLAVATKWNMKSSKMLLIHEFIFFGLWHTAILITTYFG